MDDSIICRYEWTAAHHEEASREHLRLLVRPSIRWLLHAIFFFFAVVYVASLARGEATFQTGTFFFVIWAPYLLGQLGPLWPWLQRLRFARRPDAGVTIEWTANEEGLRVKTGDIARSEVAWRAITKCARVRHGFLIYGTEKCFHGEAIFYLLPYSGFASPELAARFGLLAEKRALRFEHRS